MSNLAGKTSGGSWRVDKPGVPPVEAVIAKLGSVQCVRYLFSKRFRTIRQRNIKAQHSGSPNMGSKVSSSRRMLMLSVLSNALIVGLYLFLPRLPEARYVRCQAYRAGMIRDRKALT